MTAINDIGSWFIVTYKDFLNRLTMPFLRISEFSHMVY
nr:MAG TPA: hypothetical protein [Caudoviricetes sp.]